jgi:rhodanese-related sulfurtransferase
VDYFCGTDRGDRRSTPQPPANFSQPSGLKIGAIWKNWMPSLKALNFLRQQGFKYLKSVNGGITAWSEEIDSKVPRY